MGLQASRPETLPIVDGELQVLGFVGLPRGRVASVRGGPPGARLRRFDCWAQQLVRSGYKLLWLDPLSGRNQELAHRPNPRLMQLSPRSFEATDLLLCQLLPALDLDLVILESLDDLVGESELVRSLDEGLEHPLAAGLERRFLARWTGLCWRHQCGLLCGSDQRSPGRRALDDHASLRLQLRRSTGALQGVESRCLSGAPGWRRSPLDP